MPYRRRATPSLTSSRRAASRRPARAFTRDYDGFPTLLVVTTRKEAEARFAYQAYLAQRQRESVPLSVLFTTTRRMDHDSGGVLGPIDSRRAELESQLIEALTADEPHSVETVARCRRELDELRQLRRGYEADLDRLSGQDEAAGKTGAETVFLSSTV